MDFLYVSDARDWVRCVPPHVEELVPAALVLLQRPFQARHGFIPRRCLMTEVSCAPTVTFLQRCCLFFFIFHMLAGRASRWYRGEIGQVSLGLKVSLCRSHGHLRLYFTSIVPRKVATRVLHTVICDRDRPLPYTYSTAMQ